ncbi:HNH endonuclease signature motif containing protein [Pseudonocardia sp. GCM10023141]|uniref:HNH endonuclease signature motif containing protein n=1 Tax=Pseudonocardia sp. GCM10023141 TaxID=3252653 RepID=UPI00360BF12C
MGDARVPQELAGMAPGRELAGLLERVELAQLPHDRLNDVLIAQNRQLAREQARMFAVTTEIARRRPSADPNVILRDSVPQPYAADEVRAALALTRRTAERETELAFTVVEVMPLVQAALELGQIDRGRAWVFTQHLTDLSAAQIEVICRAVLPIAGRLTTGQLADRLRRLVIEIDPGFYERRYRRAVEDRRVIGYLDVDGTATIAAKGLPPEEAAVALQRVGALAAAARRRGHPGTLDQVKADVMLGLLDGSLHGLNREDIIAALQERYAEREGQAAATAAATAGATTAAAAPEGAVEVQVALTTILGRDDLPGALPGWGPIPAAAARRIVARQRRAEWRWVVVDAEGYLVCSGTTRRRPRHMSRGRPPGGIVELQVRESDLAELAADPTTSTWAPLIADIVAQYVDREAALQDLDAHPDDRLPRAALERHVECRDRTCAHPGCQAPATRSDMDHTRDHTKSGPTTTDDLSPECRHDHGLKEAGWELEQPEPGRFVWRSPLGQEYTVGPTPIMIPPLQAPDPPSLPEPEHPEEGPEPGGAARDRAPPDPDAGA